MPDFLTSEARSEHMRRIRKTDTKPELEVRRMAHSIGFRFRLYRRDLPGTPDLVFPRMRKVIFVHGCFWHQHQGCRLMRMPKSRLDYWAPKLRRNMDRDILARERLAALGWAVLIVWECETANKDQLKVALRRFLNENAMS